MKERTAQGHGRREPAEPRSPTSRSRRSCRPTTSRPTSSSSSRRRTARSRRRRSASTTSRGARAGSPSTCARATRWCASSPTSGDDDLMMVTYRGMAIRFSENEVREMGRDATGVRGVKLRADDRAISLDVVRDDADLLVVTDTGFGKRVEDSSASTARAAAARACAPSGSPRRGASSWPRSWCTSTTRCMLASTGGVLIRTAGARGLLAGPRRDRGARDEPRRGPLGRGRRRGAERRGRLARPGPVQDVEHQLDALGAEDHELVVHEQRRHAGDAELVSRGFVGADVAREGVGRPE